MAAARRHEPLTKFELKEEEEKERSVTARGAGIGIALFPSPFEGHIRPMFSLAYLLHSKGFSITIIHTHFNSPNPKDHPADFRFIPIPDGLSEDITSGEDHMALIIALNANCNEPFRSVMASLLQKSSPPVACLIVDAQLYFTRQVAEQFRLHRIVFRTSSAASFRAFAAFPKFLEKGYLPVQDHLHDVSVQEMPPLRMKDLPEFKTSKLTYVNEVLTLMIQEMRASSFLIMNTSDALERTYLEQLHTDLNIEVFSVGPLHKLFPYIPTNSKGLRMESDTLCIKWLDEQPSGSVLYVSFGSLACMNKEDLMEIAWGLTNSKQRFLWVIRLGLVRMELQAATLLKEIEDEIRDRGRIVSWAPQQEVLQHNAVGGFWTHCGWNSVLESICEGVPMLCYPYFGDQNVNARYISYVWKVGLQMECKLDRNVIKKFVQRLMIDEEGKEIKERVTYLKYDISSCLQKEGSLHATIERLVNHIMDETTIVRTSKWKVDTGQSLSLDKKE